MSAQQQQQRTESAVSTEIAPEEVSGLESESPVSNEVMLEQVREHDAAAAAEVAGDEAGLREIWEGLFGGGKKGKKGKKEEPKQETPKVEAPKVEAPKVEAPPETEEKGGLVYTCSSDAFTLRALAKHSYGHEFYWTNIRDHAKTQSQLVEASGALLYPRMGTISTPKIQVPKTGSPGDAPTGGEDKPFKIKREVVPQGSLAIWPDAWNLPMNVGLPGDIKVKEGGVAAKKVELTEAGKTDRETLVTEVKDAGEGVDHIDEAAAGTALAGLSKLPVTEINAAIAGMGNEKWNKIKGLAPAAWLTGEGHGRYVAGMKKKLDGSKPSNDELKTFFDLAADADVYALQELMAMRFNFKVGGRDGGGWTAGGLRRAWEKLALLPPEHVENNDSLDMFLRDTADAGGGYYRGSDESSVMGYDETNLNATGSYGEVMVNGKDEGLHSSVNLFDCVLRHEIGHAVDKKLGVETYAKATETAGKWKTYSTADEFVTDVIATHPDGMTKYAKPVEYEQALRKAVKENKSFDAALEELKKATTIPADTPAYVGGLGGPIDILRTPELWSHDKSPWYKQPSRDGVGQRRFHQAYSWLFVSYKAQTYEDRAVSAYQFRAPGEWFAEAYAAFYSDHPDVTGKAPGTALRTRDNTTAEYIKTNVDKNHSFPVEVPAVTESGTTGGDGKTAISGATS